MNSKRARIFAATIFLMTFCLLFSVGGAAAQVVFDSASRGAAFSNTGVLSLTWQHTVTAGGTNRALFVGISTTVAPLLSGAPICTTQPLLCIGSPLSGNTSARVISVTYNGVAMQQVGFQVSSDMAQAVEIFRLVAPSTGTHNVVVMFNPIIVFQVVGGSTSFTGVSQTTPNGVFTSAFGNNNAPTVSVGDAVNGDVVLDALGVPPSANNAVVGANQTERYNGRTFFNNSYDLGAGSTEPGTAATETMSWTTTNVSNWALAAVAVKQSIITAAGVAVGGRVVNSHGRGVPRAVVSSTDAQGKMRLARTNFFGYYRFEQLAAGETYIFNVESKSFTFAPRVLIVNEDISDLNLIVQ